MLRLPRDVVGIDCVVFGTDFPYLRRDIALRCTLGPPPLCADGIAVSAVALGGLRAPAQPRLSAVRR